MFGFVSKKEFEDLRQLTSQISQNASGLIYELQRRIDKLEAANNCRDGKHEWESTQQIVQQGNFDNGVATIRDIKIIHTKCKHCAIKKDEWEKQLIDTDLPTLKKRMCGDKPQPKRKKGKK